MELVAGQSRRLFLFLALVAGLALACWPATASAGDDVPLGEAMSGNQEAARPAGPAFEYTARLWQTDEGLPNNYVRAIVQTPDGYLWVGTSAGLARFDGLRFTSFNPRNTPPLQNGNISAHVRGSGRHTLDWHLWRRIGLFEGRSFHPFGPTNGPAGNELSALCVSQDGSLWIGTTTGLSQYKDNRFTTIRTRVVCPRTSSGPFVKIAPAAFGLPPARV